MTLRRLLTLAMLLFTGLVLVGAVSLSWSTNRMRQDNDRMLRNFENARLSSALQLSLFRYRHHDWLWTGPEKNEEFNQRQEAEEELWMDLAALRQQAQQASTAKRLQDLQHDVNVYLRSLEEARARYSQDVARAHADVDPIFDRLQVSLDQLVAEATANVARSQADSRQLDRQTDVAGAALAVSALLLCVAMVGLLWRSLYRPVVQLRADLERYARGKRDARCELTGPTEFVEIATTFNNLADRLEAQRSAQLRFVAAVAHDLRNPLASMKLYSQLVRPDRPLPDEARIHKAFDVIERQVDRLTRMSTDLLDATRIEAGELELHLGPVDLIQVAREVLGLLGENVPRHHISLDGPAVLEVLGDGTRLYQVLMNLVSNGIKYSPQGGAIVVSLRRIEREVVLSVADEGVGIAPTELERVFEPFRRSEGLKDRIPGVGLGLSVTRRIVEAHGGRLEVRSTLGQGSVFTVRLPVAQAGLETLEEVGEVQRGGPEVGG